MFAFVSTCRSLFPGRPTHTQPQELKQQQSAKTALALRHAATQAHAEVAALRAASASELAELRAASETDIRALEVAVAEAALQRDAYQAAGREARAALQARIDAATAAATQQEAAWQQVRGVLCMLFCFFLPHIPTVGVRDHAWGHVSLHAAAGSSGG